ncbi:MAG: 2-phospho-L-lactate guanylyltransferase [Thermoprotei archaeon]|nr:MAG: 2-phospho-L-lactate guanylyltransferase [Thermoprotei archaeon]
MPLRVFAVVPVKKVSEGKSRLTQVLDPAFRTGLILAMLEDVLSTLRKARLLEGGLVVSPSTEVSKLAKLYGFGFLKETSSRGLNAAVELGVKAVYGLGAEAALIVPADIPLVEPEDLDRLISTGLKLRKPFMVIAPSHDGGTNALLVTLPTPLRFRFGPESFEAHLEEALRHGLSVEVYSCSRVGLDLDDEDDIRLILELGKHKKTGRYLREKLSPRGKVPF